MVLQKHGIQFMEEFLLLEMGFASQNKEAREWDSFILCLLRSAESLLQSSINLIRNTITSNKHFLQQSLDCIQHSHQAISKHQSSLELQKDSIELWIPSKGPSSLSPLKLVFGALQMHSFFIKVLLTCCAPSAKNEKVF